MNKLIKFKSCTTDDMYFGYLTPHLESIYYQLYYYTRPVVRFREKNAYFEGIILCECSDHKSPANLVINIYYSQLIDNKFVYYGLKTIKLCNICNS